MGIIEERADSQYSSDQLKSVVYNNMHISCIFVYTCPSCWHWRLVSGAL